MIVVQINTNPSRRQLNQFGFIWMGFVAFFGVIALFRFNSSGLARDLWAAAIVVPVIGWLVPKLLAAGLPRHVPVGWADRLRGFARGIGGSLTPGSDADWRRKKTVRI